MVLVSDFETTFWNKGNPFDVRNKAVCLASKHGGEPSGVTFDCHHDGQIEADLFVFFNAKFDLHWWRKCGQDVSKWKIHCCQVAEFLLEGQQNRFPSLDATAAKYGLGQKIDVVEKEYWSKGINTDAIPQDILAEYACQDVDLTYAIYQRQVEQFAAQPQLYKLFKLMMLDLLVLEEMEWNGLIYDEQLCNHKSLSLGNEIQKITTALSSLYPDVPINHNSGDQLSVFLYGGTITAEYKEHVGFFKSGTKVGQPKYANKTKEHILPQMFKPLPNTALAKPGFYKTDEGTLRKLKGNKKIITMLLKLAELEKLNGTYYKGIPAINEQMNWPAGKLHGQFHQCVAATGRLSSSKPNLQNMASDCLDIFVSRYD